MKTTLFFPAIGMTEKTGRKLVRAFKIALSICFLGWITTKSEAAWPERQVTVIVPYAAGGSADILARLVAAQLQSTFGQPFVIENRAGAGGNLGTIAAARAPKDGYTIIVGTLSSHVINQLIYKKTPFDTTKEFEPVSMIAQLPNLLVVTPNVPARNVADLITYMKANPDKLTYGSSGVGTSSHLSAELLKRMTGTKFSHVPFRSAGENSNSLAGGHTDLAFDNMSLMWPLAQSKKVVPLAVSSSERSAVAPDVPTIAETLPGFEVTAWVGMFAPAGTPDPIVQALAGATKSALDRPDVKAIITESGAVAAPMAPEMFATYIKGERKRWAETVEAAGVSIDQ